MAESDFWEVTLLDPLVWRRIPLECGLWFETPMDRRLRWARQQLFYELGGIVRKMMVDELTNKQWQVVRLYLDGKKQEEIAAALGIKQCTVSRCLFGTKRKNHWVGGVVAKIRKIVNGPKCPPEIKAALTLYAARRQEILA